MFKRKYKDFVILSVGKVYFKPITMDIYNNCYSQASGFYKKKVFINNALLFQKFEEALVCISKRTYKKLLIRDGLKLREKLKEILIREKLMNVSNDDSDNPQDLGKLTPQQMKELIKQKQFNNQDKEWFNQQEQRGKQKLAGVQDGRR